MQQQASRLRVDRSDMRTMQIMEDLKRTVDYIEKTDWLF
jgi:hypothetical protein